MLHDDDWWGPAHLANALAALETDPDASVYGSGHFVVSGESSMLNCSGNLFPWFGANYPAFAPVWRLSRLNVLMAELLGTVAHYSTMVIRTEALRKSAYVYELGNPFDNDRMLLFALSNFGPLLFNPTPGVFVRNHGVQDCFLFSDDARQKHMCGTTRWMVESSGKSFDLIANTFAQRMAKCPEAAVATLQALAMREWCVPGIETAPDRPRRSSRSECGDGHRPPLQGNTQHRRHAVVPQMFARRAQARLFARGQRRLGIAQHLLGRCLQRRERIDQRDLARIVAGAHVGTFQVDRKPAARRDLEKLLVGRRVADRVRRVEVRRVHAVVRGQLAQNSRRAAPRRRRAPTRRPRCRHRSSPRLHRRCTNAGRS